jgi:hypothetical protein
MLIKTYTVSGNTLSLFTKYINEVLYELEEKLIIIFNTDKEKSEVK